MVWLMRSLRTWSFRTSTLASMNSSLLIVVGPPGRGRTPPLCTRVRTGPPRWFELQLVPLSDVNGRHILGAARRAGRPDLEDAASHLRLELVQRQARGKRDHAAEFSVHLLGIAQIHRSLRGRARRSRAVKLEHAPDHGDPDLIACHAGEVHADPDLALSFPHRDRRLPAVETTGGPREFREGLDQPVDLLLNVLFRDLLGRDGGVSMLAYGRRLTTGQGSIEPLHLYDGVVDALGIVHPSSLLTATWQRNRPPARARGARTRGFWKRSTGSRSGFRNHWSAPTPMRVPLRARSPWHSPTRWGPPSCRAR